MFRRLLTVALVSGFVAGIFMTAIQTGWVIPLIEQAEIYEICSPDLECPPGATLKNAAPLERLAYTALFNVLSGVAFGLLLAAGFALHSEPVNWIRGIAWGMAGFAAFALAPSLVLPPEPPGAALAGVAYGSLVERQIWWLACAAFTAAGLAFLFLTTRWGFKILGLAAIALPDMLVPYVLGVPLLKGSGPVPDEFVTEFITASLVTTGLFWIALGGLSGFVYRRLT